MTTRTLTELRYDVATARIALRKAEDQYRDSKALAEAEAIEAAGGNIGKNAEDRERNLILALQKNDEYQVASSMLRDVQADVDLFQAALECALDQRREREWASRDRLTAVLERLAVQQADEEPHDTVLTKLADSVSVEVGAPARPFQVGDIVAFVGYPNIHCRIVELGICGAGPIAYVAYDDGSPLNMKNTMTYLVSNLVLITPAPQEGS